MWLSAKLIKNREKTCGIFITLVFCLIGSIALTANFPYVQLLTIFPSGGKQGSTIEISVTGVEMDQVNKLYFSHPGIISSPIPVDPLALTTKLDRFSDKFKVKIGKNVPTGIYEVRIVGRYGISNARAFFVGDQDEKKITSSPNSHSAALEIPLGTTVNGQATKDTGDYFKFEGKKGQRIIIEGWGRRIDSKIDATLSVYDASGKELQSNRDTYRLDPFIDFLVPKNGIYTVKIYDYLYRGGPEYSYRLSIGIQPHIEYIFPPAGLPGTRQQYVVYGQNLPGSVPSSIMNSNGIPLEEKKVEISIPNKSEQTPLLSLLKPSQIVIDAKDHQIISSKGTSNSFSLQVATAPVILENEPNNKKSQAQKVKLPCEINGQFFPNKDVDWIIFEAKKDHLYWIEVFSHRMGLSTDPSVSIYRILKDFYGEEKTELVVNSDDWNSNLGDKMYSPGTRDPLFSFKAEQDSRYLLKIHDLSASQDSRPSHLYRLSIRESSPDFRLLVVADDPGGSNDDSNIWEPSLRRGGKTRMNVLAIRRDGFDGKIKIKVEGLPPGIGFNEATIPAKSTGTFLIFEAASSVPSWHGSIQVTGTGMINGKKVVRNAHHASLVWQTGSLRTGTIQSRVVRNLTLGVRGNEIAPKLPEIKIEKQLWEVSLEGELAIPIKIVNRSGLKGELNLRLKDLPGIRDGTSKLKLDEKTNKGIVKFKLRGGRNIKPGKYTFSVVAFGQLTYRNQPEAVSLAHQEMVRIEQLVNSQKLEAAAAVKLEQKSTKSIIKLEKSLLLAERARRKAENRLRLVTERAKPRSVRVVAHSQSLDLIIHPAPISIVTEQSFKQISPGNSLQVPVSIKRLFDYVEPVEVTFEVPTYLLGIEAESITIPKGKTTEPLMIQVSPDVKPGNYHCKLQVIIKLNNRELKVQQPIKLQVVPEKNLQNNKVSLKNRQ